MRYFFEVSYAGTHYHGWQNQANAVGVQEVVENVMSKILGEKIDITASGRTDTGVHCLQQFFHADISADIQRDSFLIRLNSFLPKDIAIKNLFKVRPTAHARFDARERTYVYTITRKKNPFLTDYSFYFFRDLDIDTMNVAANLLTGKQDFEAFSKVKTDVNHFECTIMKAVWKEHKDVMTFTISANRFLRGMVRAIVGTLLDVGSGKTTIEEFHKIIQGKDRKNAGTNVPAEGLSLVKIKYSKKIYLK